LRDVLLSLSKKHACNGIAFSMAAMTPILRGEQCPRVNPLLELGCENTLSQTWVIDIRREKAALWNDFEGRARTAIRKAEKRGVTVRLADQPGDLDQYYNLHCETYRRTGVSPHPRAYFEAIWRDFFTQGLARIWFAELDGKVLAAENFGVFKGAAIYWTGAASAEGLEAGANPLLQWTAIQWMADAGIAWYETGEAFPSVSGGKARGLSDFKKSFGGELYPYYKGRINTESKLFKIIKLAKGVIS
jgi:lipid II:glycine glycyltransferase (peptidoglycan interpeptide bridge formation enzyme)